MKTFAITFSLLLITLLFYGQSSINNYDEHGNVLRNSTIEPLVPLTNNQEIANVWNSAGPFGGDVLDIAMDPTNLQRGFAAAGYPYMRIGEENPWMIVESLLAISPSGIHCIEINGNGTMFAAGNYSYGKVFISTDSGESWVQKNIGVNAGVFSLTLDPSDPNTIYATTSAIFGSTQSNIVAKSSDEGNTWTLLNLTSVMPAGYGCVALAVDPGAPQTLFAIGSEGISNATVATSTDGGSTWQSAMGNLPTGKPLNAIKIFNGAVYVCGGQLFGGNVMGVYKSENYGTTWTNMSTTFPNKVANDILINPDDPNKMYVATEGDGIYYTIDGGLNWTFDTGGAGDNGSARKLIFQVDEYESIIGGFLSLGVCYSGDGGANYVSVTEGIATLTINDIEVDPNNPEIMLASFEAENSGGCYLYNNDEWSLVESLPATRFSAVDIGIDGTLYAWSNGPTTVAAEGVYKSSDGGMTWENMGPNIGSVFETQIWSIATSETDPNLIFISGNNFGVNGWASMIYRSADGGENWENVFMGPDNDAFRFIHIVPESNDMDLYTAYKSETAGGFLKSIDGGSNWLPINDGIPASAKWCGAIVSDPQNSDVLYGGVGGYGGVPGTIYKSEDAGSTWTGMGFSLANYSKIADIIINPDNSNVIYAASSQDGVYMTSDGTTWTAANEGLPATNISGFSRIIDDGTGNKVFYASTITNSCYWTEVFNPSATTISERSSEPIIFISNPVKDAVILQVKEKQTYLSEINLYNLSGQLLMQTSVNGLKTTKTTIYLDVRPGIYLLLIHTNKGEVTRKLMVR
ncbi:MAG: T9SS type A sorting domain-containing protein [Bacteroidetes bacterium]|nr:T9SS type A sorting domain-containing protein [Bacteroidota bacterium]